MDLATRYLGLDLAHPIVPGASPLSMDLDAVRRLEDAGAPLVTMHSLFEEQITGEATPVLWPADGPTNGWSEPIDLFPTPEEFGLGPDEYLEHVAAVKHAVRVPVVASLNGATRGDWLDYARLVSQAGADALELNLYQTPTDPARSADDVERELCAVVRAAAEAAGIPVAVKIGPYHTSLAHFARALVDAGARALVLFNRFHTPDLDPDRLESVPALRLSDSSELLPRLRWIALLHDRIGADLAVTGGVHTPIDAAKSLLVGADVVQVASTLLLSGPDRVRSLRAGLARWMTENGYDSVAGMRGSLSAARCPDPRAYDRANYQKILKSWRTVV